jgi:hypothetical protein
MDNIFHGTQISDNHSGSISESTIQPEGDPFDLEELRPSQDFTVSTGVKKLITTVPTRKPHRQEFIRVHPDPTWRLETVALELKEEREVYLVDRALWAELPGDLSPRVLVTAISWQGVVFIWPLRLPGADGRQDVWSRSALEAAQHAMGQWVKVAANMALGAYEVYTAQGPLPEPEWSPVTFQELLQIAFKDRFIRDIDHPVLRKLRGEL